MADALHFARVKRAFLQQAAQPIGQLNLS
jgi:hypothetical protein